MGVDSDFRLGFEPKMTDEQETLVMEMVQKLSGYSAGAWEIANDKLNNYLSAARWYQVSSDLQAVSRAFPGLRITCHQIVESGEEYMIYVHRGELQEEEGYRTFDPCKLW
jgi:hypothetical protein